MSKNISHAINQEKDSSHKISSHVQQPTTHTDKGSARSYVLVNPTVSEENSYMDMFNIMAPIVTFILGFVVQWVLSYFSNRRALKRYFRRWQVEIAALENPITNQIKSLEEFIASQNSEQYSIPDPTLYTGVSGISFQTLDKGKFLEAVQNSISAKRKEKLAVAMEVCNSTLGYIEIVSTVYSDLRKKLDDFLENSSDFFKQFNEDYRQVILHHRELGVEIEKKHGSAFSDQAFKDLNELMHVYHGPGIEPVTDIFSLEKTFFKAVDLILAQLRQYDTCRSFYEHNHACITNIQYIREERRIFNHHVNIAIRKYKQLLEELDQVASLSPKM
ncbi:MAG: hypothetical protein V4604_13685 [Bacteroidota bacterium]